MALTAKLQIKQLQSLVMTPQLMQSIRLLQFGHLELAAFVARELESNPLLEMSGDEDRVERQDSSQELPMDGPEIGAELETSTAALAENLGTSLDNVFEADAGERALPMPLSDPWKSPASAASLDGDAPDLDTWCAAKPTLREYLHQQRALAFKDKAEWLISGEIIDSLDEDGYLRRQSVEIATVLGVAVAQVEKAILTIQTFDPAGVCARDLGECLSIQLAERNRLDPAIARLLENLDLLALRDYAGLSRLCGVDRDEIVDMLDEIRRLDPRPGKRFDHQPIEVVVPDVRVIALPDGSWSVELNPATLPKVLINRDYYAIVSRNCRNDTEKAFIADRLQSANWLVRSLDQRAQTILKVALEIVKQQDMFLACGVAHLRPLNLKTVADAIKMHESTVSRVTTNKYMMTPRGPFEMKYFFTQAIASNSGSGPHSAEAVRHKIRQMIDSELANRVLSDEAIVDRLQHGGVDIARRTVAKYRESMNIPSSVQRRREKLAFATRQAI